MVIGSMGPDWGGVAGDGWLLVRRVAMGVYESDVWRGRLVVYSIDSFGVYYSINIYLLFFVRFLIYMGILCS